MARRFAIVIGVAAVGVMALGAQTAAGGEPVDSTPPDLQLSGKKKQELGNAVKVKASCGDEACTAIATPAILDLGQREGPGGGCFKPASANLGPGETTTLKLKKRRHQKAFEVGPEDVRKALDKGNKVRALVLVDATDAAGNVATAKREIGIVK